MPRTHEKSLAEHDPIPRFVAGTQVGGIEPVCDEAPYPRYPAGEYDAECIRADLYRDPQFRTWKAKLHYRLMPGGEPICGFFNLGGKEKTHAGRRSEYRRAWIIANGEAPRKRQILTRRVFVGKLYRVRIGDVTRRFDGRSHPAGDIYSVVKEILERTWP